MENVQEYKNSEKNIKRSSTLPLYSTLLLSNPKSKYKTKKLYRVNSLQKINESSENSGLTRINSMISNTQLVLVSNKKPKRKVCFAPNYRLIKYINYNPKEAILKNNVNNEENDEKNEKKKEDNIVCFHCTCILF